MSKSCCYNSNPPLARIVCDDWHEQPGCHSQPFFKLPLENIVVDELHFMLQVTDRLEEGLIMDIMNWDEVNKCYLRKFSHSDIIFLKSQKSLYFKEVK